MSNYMTEEEQIEQIKKWWSKHGNAISTFILIAAVCFAGFRYWQWHQQKMSFQASNLYENMLVAYTNQDDKGIISRANKLVQTHQGTIYADAAHLTLAKINTDKGHYDKASKQLQAVIDNNKNSALTQIAKLRYARILLNNKQYKQALDKVDMVSNKSYLSLINELKGDIYAGMGNYKQAKLSYDAALSSSKMQKMGNLFLEMKTNDVARQQMSGKTHTKTA